VCFFEDLEFKIYFSSVIIKLLNSLIHFWLNVKNYTSASIDCSKYSFLRQFIILSANISIMLFWLSSFKLRQSWLNYFEISLAVFSWIIGSGDLAKLIISFNS
jgi:hypothetical protein